MEFEWKKILDAIFGDLNNFFTAKCFITEEVKIKELHEDYHIDNLKNYIRKNNYDIFLVKNENNKLSYIKKEDIENCKNIKDIFINNISEEKKIKMCTKIPEIIEKIKDFYYVFVYDEKNMFAGLITYADLNKPPLYSYLYIVISHFEALLRDVIEINYKEDEWLKSLSKVNQKIIRDRFNDDKSKGIEISLLECTTLCHITQILGKEKKITNLSCYLGKQNYKSKIKKILNRRNAIMHSKPLINSKEDCKDFYDFLCDFCNQIREIKNYYILKKEEKEGSSHLT